MHVQLAANSSVYWGWTSRHDVLISNSAMDTKTCSSVLENVYFKDSSVSKVGHQRFHHRFRGCVFWMQPSLGVSSVVQRID